MIWILLAEMGGHCLKQYGNAAMDAFKKNWKLSINPSIHPFSILLILLGHGELEIMIFRTKSLGFVPCVVEIERGLFHTHRQCSGCFFLFFI